jgi:hypothetical protein
MRKGKHYNLKVRSVFLLDILKMSKVTRLLQPHSNEIIIRRDVKFDENILACEPNSMFVPSLAYEPS